MVRLTMSDDSSYERASFSWDKISHSLEPEIDKLPPADRRYFKSIVKLLIGKEIRLANVLERHEYIFIKRADLILKSMLYPMLFPPEFLRSHIARYLMRLGLTISRNGLGWKFGPMGFQQQQVKQEVIGIPAKNQEM